MDPQANVSTTTREDGTFTDPAIAPGITFHRISIRPADLTQTRARLAIVHGYGDHAARYVETMTWLAARGIPCHAFDSRGHGRSSGRRAYVRRWDDYLGDLDAFLSLPELRAAPDEPPVFVLGHSHGGLIVAVAGVRGKVAEHGVAGCILSAPYLVNGLPVPRHKSLAARFANLFCPWVLIRSGIRMEMMSSDPVCIEEARQDPLLLRCATPRWYLAHQTVQAEALARAGEFTLPLLVLQGDADSIADGRGARAFHAKAGSIDKRLLIYQGFRHEPLHEMNRERVYADVLEWIQARTRHHVSAPRVTSEPRT